MPAVEHLHSRTGANNHNINLCDSVYEDTRDQLTDLERFVSEKFPKQREIRARIWDLDLKGFDKVISFFTAQMVKLVMDQHQ